MFAIAKVLHRPEAEMGVPIARFSEPRKKALCVSKRSKFYFEFYYYSDWIIVTILLHEFGAIYSMFLSTQKTLPLSLF